MTSQEWSSHTEYMDKWNVVILEDLVEVEVQGGDGHIDQDVMGTTKNLFSGVEDTSEFEAVNAEFDPESEPEFKQAFEPEFEPVLRKSHPCHLNKKMTGQQGHKRQYQD